MCKIHQKDELASEDSSETAPRTSSNKKKMSQKLWVQHQTATNTFVDKRKYCSVSPKQWCCS